MMNRKQAIKTTLKELEDFSLLMRTVIYLNEKQESYIAVLEKENLALHKKLKDKKLKGGNKHK